jgi:ribosomal protein L37AE/L43A
MSKQRGDLEARIEPYWSERPVWKSLDIDDGWLSLVDGLITDLEKTGGVPKIVQIKTKFGGLRFYVDAATEEQRALIADAERRSTHVCEECGDEGSECVIGHWYCTLCAQCFYEKNREHEDRRKGRA